MSSYKRYLIIFIFLSSLFAKEVDKDFSEDLYIVYALEYERQGNTNQARFLYEKLYDNTNNYEYYIRYLRASLATGHFKDIVKKVQNHLGDNVKEQELILRIYCVSLLNLNQTDKALEVAQKLLEVGIIVRDLTGYGQNAIRITIGTNEQNTKVFSVLDEVLEKLK